VRDAFEQVAAAIALSVEAGAALLIAVGAVEAFVLALRAMFRPQTAGLRKRARVQLGSWLLLALEFSLAGDIVKSAISPTWTAIGQLAAIAVIRTFLNYFLQQDVEREEAG
jgi:uncharacterized membrane protein